MTAELAARAGGPTACAGVEVEYVDPDRGRERRPLSACWSARFERVSPVRGLASFRGQRNWPGWWWFSRTGEHVGYESWVERDVLMALDADPGVEAVASQPMWLHWVSESGKARRHAPDFFVRRADGTGVLVDVRPDHLVRAADSAVFGATAVMAGQAGRHLIEVITGVPPGSPPGTLPRPEYDPARRSLRQRELAKHGELTGAGHQVGLSTLKRLLVRYEREGLWGVIDHRAARRTAPVGYVDPRVVAATRQAIAEETDRSTGTVGRLRRQVEQILAGTSQAGERPVMPPERTFYRLAGRLASGRHTFGSARTRRSLAQQPDGPFGAVTAARPGEWTQIDSTPLDVRVVHDDGTVDRVELTGLVDQATRTIAAAVLRPTTKAVDAALLLARALTPEPMRPGWTDALRLTRSVLPHRSLISIDERLEAAAARPVIIPETIVCDHGKAYLSGTFRAACRSLGISLAPAHPHTPTDKPVIERTLGSVASLFAQHVAGYVGSSVEHRGRNAEDGAAWSMAELQALLDEWIVSVWQNRPHEGLRDPLAPGRALTPNERYAALIDLAGYVPVPLGPEDYIELLPASWRVINSYGVKIGLRTYDSGELNPYRRQHSGIEAKNGRWEVRYDPYDISRVWIRNHHHGGWLSATWKHLRTAPVPFGEQAWNHARQLLAARGSDPATEAEIAAAAADLLDRAGQGPAPGPGEPAAPQQRQAAARDSSPRSRRVRGRTAATAGPQWPRPAPGRVGDEGSTGPADVQDEQPAEAESETPPGKVIPLPLFDARKEAEKWW